MADSSMRINALVVDAADPEWLAAFWSELLGRPVVGRMGPYVWLQRENGLGLGFQRTTEPKPTKNRMHFLLRPLPCLMTRVPIAVRCPVRGAGGSERPSRWWC